MTDRSPQSRGIAALLILLFLVVAAIVLFESSEPTPGATRSSAPAIAEPSATGAAATSTGEARRRAIEVTPSPTAAAETAALRVVVAFKAGGPVVGRGVIATRLRPGRARQSRRATTDANGHSLFLDLATGTWNVQVPGSGPQQVELVAGATSEVRVTLRRGVAIS